MERVNSKRVQKLKKHITVIANSPGEVLTWASKLADWYDVTLALLPCPFATGREENYGLSCGYFKSVIGPWETFKLSISPFRSEKFSDYFNDVVVHLGGDLAYTYLLSKKYEFKGVSYIWGRKVFDSAFQLYMVYSEHYKRILLERGLDLVKIVKVRDLLWDMLSDKLEKLKDVSYETLDNIDIVFMLGSRIRELKFLLPFILKVIKGLFKLYGRLEYGFPISPLITLNEVRCFMEELVRDELVESYQQTDEIFKVRIREGELVFVAGDIRYKAITASKLVVSIPGTKIHEAAYLEKPVLSFLPLHLPEEIPVGGLVGLLDYLPWGLGKPLKRRLILKMAKKRRFFAIPNILANKEIVPELVGKFSERELAEKISMILEDCKTRDSIIEHLRCLYSEFKEGPSVKEILDELISRNSVM